jgi:hypothetical protein
MNRPSKWVAGAVLAAAALLGAAPAFAHGRVHFGIGVNLGPYWGPYWGPAWYYPPPYYYYPPPVVAAPAAPQSYVERADQPQQQPSQAYWYYCEASRSYYPYVKECPGGWKAVPPAPPPAQ